MQDLTKDPYFQNIICSIAFLCAQQILSFIATKLKNRVPRLSGILLNRVALGVQTAFFMGANILYIFTSLPFYWAFFIISSSYFTYFTASRLDRFWRIGVSAGDESVAKGIDYLAALKLCTNSIDFMGIGADKLTSCQPAFEDAIKRCHRTHQPIRFLLLDPTNEILVTAARQQNQQPDEYRRKVIVSLERLAALKADYHIEVRLYSPEFHKIPIFRLFFINHSTCLFSYYVLGEGSGSQLPQLHLDSSASDRDIGSFYYPFKLYFNEVWEEARIWDFNPDSLN